MKFQIISIGQKTPGWIEQGLQTYLQRLPKHWQVIQTEIPLPKRNKSTQIDKIKTLEASLIRQKILSDHLLIVLDEKGINLSSKQLCNKILDWQSLNQNVSFVIGGPDGLDTELIKQAHFIWSLSALTLPHFMVPLLIAEQLYRSYALSEGHPYHRD